MDWRGLPSLAALRAFEATARTGGFSAAARELNVTHAAVAQQVRALERALGPALVRREGAGLAVTGEGARLAAALSEGFGTIAEAVARLRAERDLRPLRVTLTPAFAENWLMPRIGAFWQRHPEIELELAPSVAPADLRREGFDLAIRFGEGDWPGLRAEPLVLAPFAVVGAPALARGRGLAQMGDPTRYRWLLSHAVREQAVWGAALGLDFSRLAVEDLPTNGMALSAVRAGLGLSIQSLAVIEADVAAGTLAVLHQGDPGRLGYWTVTRQEAPPARLATLLRWLRRTARAEGGRRRA